MDNPTPTNPIAPAPAPAPIESGPTFEKPIDLIPKEEPRPGFPQPPVTPVPPTPQVVNQPVQPPVEESKPKNNLLIIVAIILLVMAVGAVGYFVYKNVLVKTQPITSYDECAKAKGSIIQETFPPVCVTKDGQRFVQEVLPTPTPDVTASWKTFTGKVFEYKYPDNLYLVDLNNNDSVNLFADKESADASASCTENKQGAVQNPCPAPLIQIVITSAKAEATPQTASSSGTIKFSLSTNPQGIQMLKNDEVISGLGNSIVFTAYVVKSSTVYTITIQTTPLGYWKTLYPNDTKTDSEILNSESTLINQILSTFAFVGQISPTATPTISPTSSPSATPTGF